MKLFWRGVLVTLVILTWIEPGLARNRFNVFTHSDSRDMTNLESFYATLDTFGVSAFYSLWPDSSGKYRGDFDIYTAQFYQHIDIGDSLTLFNDTRYGLNARMQGSNDNPLYGYLRNTALGIGAFDFDDDLGHNILYADPDQHDAGYLHPPFREGCFHLLRPLGDGAKITYEVLLKLPEATLPDTTVVAQLIFWHKDTCSTSTNPNSVYRYNDTLLAVYNGSGYTMYPAIDSIPATLEMGYCGESSVKNNGSSLNRVCYAVNNTVICTLPYKFVKDIHVGDFADTSWQKFTMECGAKGGWNAYNYLVNWTDQEFLYLDSLSVYNDQGRRFDSLIVADKQAVADSIQNWYDAHPYAKGNVKGLYPIDEPSGVEFQQYMRLNWALDLLPSDDYPLDQFTTLGAFNNPMDDTLSSQYFDAFIKYSEQDYFMFDLYNNHAFYTSSSEVDDFTNVQCMFDGIVRGLTIAAHRAQWISDNMWPTGFWVTYPTVDWWKEYKEDDETYHYKYTRMFTPNEIKAAVNLALVYGAKGIGYWEYMGKETHDKSASQPMESTKALTSEDLEEFAPTMSCDMIPAGPDYCEYASCSCGVGPAPFANSGLVYQDNGEPYGLWWAVRDVNYYLDSMAEFFLDAE